MILCIRPAWEAMAPLWDMRHKKLQKVLLSQHPTSSHNAPQWLCCTLKGWWQDWSWWEHLRTVREETQLLSHKGKGSQTGSTFVSYTAVCPGHLKRHRSSWVTPLVHLFFLPLGKMAAFASSQPFGAKIWVGRCQERSDIAGADTQLSDSHCLKWNGRFKTR